MFIFQLNFFCSLFLLGSTRFYAFVETLFVIDQTYFPPLSHMSYEHYVRTIVDTANIIFQSANDLDVKIEIVVSKILYLNIAKPQTQEPPAYESVLRQNVADYDRYDSIVLFWYQPWEGDFGAQGYAMLKGACHPNLKMMYLVPHQNAAFYLAHELGHQLGLEHQINGPCFTEGSMSVMTESHTASYERARWTKCENDWINQHICDFECLFNRPNHYQPIKNKFATQPGQKMTNDQQAKLIEMNSQNLGESSANSYMKTDMKSRCLYLQYYYTLQKYEYRTAFSPMLPASDCGEDSICYLDDCVPKIQLDPQLLQIEYDTNVQDLTEHCSSGGQPSALTESNNEPRQPLRCVDWEDDFLCHPDRQCPPSGKTDAGSLYMKHVCCAKCASNQEAVVAIFSSASSFKITGILFLLPVLTLFYRSMQCSMYTRKQI